MLVGNSEADNESNFSQTAHRSNLSHVDTSGKASMVDVGPKRISRRGAIAQGSVWLGKEAFSAVQNNTLAKGDVLSTARLAGIMAAKQTSNLIPLCHSLPLDW